MKEHRKVKYIVNEEKRTVTCLLPGNLREVYVGISRCNPEDEWNEELGKELARKRAIVKQCQDELENLPDIKCIEEAYIELLAFTKKIQYWTNKAETIKNEIASICNE